MYEQLQSMQKMGPLSQMLEMLPDTGFNHLLKGASGDAGQAKLKSYMVIMDSMTDEELDVPKVPSLPPPHTLFLTSRNLFSMILYS